MLIQKLTSKAKGNLADSPEKRGLDRHFVNCGQKHEKEYLAETLGREFPSAAREEIMSVIENICSVSGGRRGRDEFMHMARQRLGR